MYQTYWMWYKQLPKLYQENMHLHNNVYSTYALCFDAMETVE